MSLLNDKEKEVHAALDAHLWVYIDRGSRKYHPQSEPGMSLIRVCPHCWEVQVKRAGGWGEPYCEDPFWEESMVNMALKFCNKKKRKL